MAESQSIDQWQELVKSCNESGKSKAVFCRANSLNFHQFLYWRTKFNKKSIHYFCKVLICSDEGKKIYRIFEWSDVMPQVDLKYSHSISLDAERLLNDIELLIYQCDDSAGACKSRAYPADTYRHHHVLLEASFLRKPHRDEAFMKNMRDKMAVMLVSYLPKACYYAIELRFSGDYYLTAQVS